MARRPRRKPLAAIRRLESSEVYVGHKKQRRNIDLSRSVDPLARTFNANARIRLYTRRAGVAAMQLLAMLELRAPCVCSVNHVYVLSREKETAPGLA